MPQEKNIPSSCIPSPNKALLLPLHFLPLDYSAVECHAKHPSWSRVPRSLQSGADQAENILMTFCYKVTGESKTSANRCIAISPFLGLFDVVILCIFRPVMKPAPSVHCYCGCTQSDSSMLQCTKCKRSYHAGTVSLNIDAFTPPQPCLHTPFPTPTPTSTPIPSHNRRCQLNYYGQRGRACLV